MISRDVVFINEEKGINSREVRERHQPVDFIELLDWSESDYQPSNETTDVQLP